MDVIHQTAKSEFENFNMKNDRLDTLFQRNMASIWLNAWTVVEFALMISLGDASVGQGFSINKEVIVENQDVTSLMAKRLNKDHVLSLNGVTNMAITREMVPSGATAKYTSFLAQKTEQQQTIKLDLKRKAKNEAVRAAKQKQATENGHTSSFLKFTAICSNGEGLKTNSL